MTPDPHDPAHSHPPAAPPEQPHSAVQQSEPAAKATRAQVHNVEVKAMALLLFTMVLVAGSVLFLLNARGFFEAKQGVILLADNAEGIAPGMDMTFSGFPIGRVRDTELGKDGRVRIHVEVTKKDAHWLRTSSVFTIEKGLVGGPQLRAYSGLLSDPPLPDGAERPVLRGDANTQIQQVIGAARDVLDNLNQITGANSELTRTISNLQNFSRKLQGNQGALHAVFGNEQDARKLVQAIEQANAIMAKVDRMVVKADSQVFGSDGLVNESRTSVRQLNTLLGDARNSLKRVDTVLTEAQGVASNVRAGTQDLGALRQDVEANLRKIEDMINDLNRKWPLNKKREVQLP